MRVYILSILFLCLAIQNDQAQILKQIGNRVKENVRARADRKVDQAIDKALDTIVKKPTKKEKNTQTEPPIITKENKSTGTKPDAVVNTNTDMTPQDGYILAKVFPGQTLVGASLVISGETMASDKFKEVSIVVTPPGGANNKVNTYRALINNPDGSFKLPFSNTNAEGEYKVKVNSPDGKASKILFFTIYDFDGLDEIGEKIKDLMDEASKNLKDIVAKIKDQSASKDDKQIEEKMKEVDDKIQAEVKMLTSINEACGKLGKAAKEGKGMPENVRKNLGDLNDLFQKQGEVMKEQVERAKHKPADNTICEYLVMLNEACAAFSTITNLYAKSILGIIRNVAVDKALPKKVGEINKKAPNGLSEDNDFWAKEPAKITATALFDTESLFQKLGKAEIAGDLIQFASDVLLKKYCGIFKGEMEYHYENIYRHEGANWWKYTYDCGATVSLRYPKNQKGGTIKMKGNIEGNATNFTFGFDVKHLLPRNVVIYSQRSIKPVAMPFVSSQKDEDLGFGAGARAVATPAYFNLAVDAEYNTETETITIFYNQALIDFSPAVSNRGLIMIIAAGIPIIKYVDFPINKMGLSFGAALKRNPEFKVTGGSKNFTGNSVMSIGAGSSIEHKANFTIKGHKE